MYKFQRYSNSKRVKLTKNNGTTETNDCNNFLFLFTE